MGLVTVALQRDQESGHYMTFAVWQDHEEARKDCEAAFLSTHVKHDDLKWTVWGQQWDLKYRQGPRWHFTHYCVQDMNIMAGAEEDTEELEPQGSWEVPSAPL